MTEVILVTNTTNDVWDVFAQPCPDILELVRARGLRMRGTITGSSGGAYLVKSTKCLCVLLVSDNQGPLFKREFGQT